MSARKQMTTVCAFVFFASCALACGCSQQPAKIAPAGDATVNRDAPESQPQTPSSTEHPPAIPATKSATIDQRASRHTGEWISLFDGNDLSAWTEHPALPQDGEDSTAVSERWLTRDGVLVCNSATHGWLASAREYADFEFECDFKLPAKANGGIYIRHSGKGPLAKSGLEIQVIEESTWPSPLKPTERTGAIWGLVGPNQSVQKPVGQWNTMRIRCDGDVVQVTLNDTLVADVIVSKENWTSSGYVLFSNWRGQANGSEFRSIRVRELVP